MMKKLFRSAFFLFLAAFLFSDSAFAQSLPHPTLGPISGASLPINPKTYGAVCNNATDDHVALQAAATTAIAQRRPLYIPGFCASSTSITLAGSINIIGDGVFASAITMTADAPAFIWNITSTTENFDWHDFSIYGYTTSTGPAILTQGGTGSTFLDRGQFRNIQPVGFLYGMEANNPTSINWTIFDAFNCVDSVAVQIQYCVYFPQGSGTGNVFTKLQPNMFRSNVAVLRYEGSGKVVGDIVVASGHFCCNGSVISIGSGTLYRSRINLIGSQFDAGVTKAFDFDATGTEYTNIRVVGNNVGGAAITGLPKIADRSISDDQDVGVRRAGNFKSTNGAGTFSTPLFGLVFPSSRGVPTPDAYDSVPMTGWIGTSCSVVIQGLIGNVGASVSKSEFLVTYNNTGSPTFTAGPTSATASAWTVGSTASTDTMTISANITQTGSSIFEAQITCTGGMFTLNRL